MENGNKDKWIAMAIYEALGTSFIMYALMMERGVFGPACIFVTMAMMVIAWNVSGGHFNPAISLGVYISEKKFGENLVPLLIMIVGQFAGAFLGLLFGYLALVAKDDMQTAADLLQADYNASVPESWLGMIIPKTASNRADIGTATDGFSRDWQTFWAMLVTSLILVLTVVSVKSKATQISAEPMLQVFAVTLVLLAMPTMNLLFGTAGFNPALASAYIMFEVMEYDTPNQYYTGTELNHYLWAYIIGPLVGAVAAGFLHIIHSKCSAKKGSSSDETLL
jgi:glycerol uptake facilitator-like aquaporin